MLNRCVTLPHAGGCRVQVRITGTHYSLQTPLTTPPPGNAVHTAPGAPGVAAAQQGTKGLSLQAATACVSATLGGKGAVTAVTRGEDCIRSNELVDIWVRNNLWGTVGPFWTPKGLTPLRALAELYQLGIHLPYYLSHHVIY